MSNQTRDRNKSKIKLLPLCCVGWGLFPLVQGGLCFGEEAFDPKVASFDTLLSYAQRYGAAGLKRERKKLARDELFSRKADTLQYLLDHIHIENIWIRILAQELTERLEAKEAVPILVEALDSEHAKTRKYAAYFLGFYRTPEYGDRVILCLDEEEVSGAAIRTLGKWKIRHAVSKIIPTLKHEEERRRIVAANALRDIGDPQAIPFLMEALKDVHFTVRKTAARALSTMGPSSEKALLQALSDAEDEILLREIIQILGVMRSRKAVGPLQERLTHHDEGVRSDAANALREIDPREAKKWLRSFAWERHPSVGAITSCFPEEK